MTTPPIHGEQFIISGETLVARTQELARRSEVRRITIQNEDGQTLIEIPVSRGVAGASLLPVWAVVGAISALAASYTLGVETTADRTTGACALIPEPNPVFAEAGTGLKGGDPQC